jgi:hypothetical protein
MKKIFSLSAAAVALIAVTACSSQDFADFFKGDDGSIKAVIDSEVATRSSATDAGEFTWAAGDEISVFNETSNLEYKLSSGAGTNAASFSPTTAISTSKDKEYAFYPYNAAHSISVGTLKVTLPATYKYEVNAKGQLVTNTNALMIGVWKDDSFQFRHIAGVLRLAFESLPADARQLKFTTSTRITGEFTTTIGAGEDGATELNQDTADATDDSKTVTISWDNAITDFSGDARFMIPLPIGTYNGFEFSILDASGNVLKNSNDVELTYKTETTNTMARRQLGLYPKLAITVDVDGVIVDEVTTADATVKALTEGGSIKLGDDIDLSDQDQITIPEDKTVTLDLNGHKLTLAGSSTKRLLVSGTLNIKDSTGKGSIEDALTSDTYTKAEGENYSSLIWIGQVGNLTDFTKGAVNVYSGTINAGTYGFIVQGGCELNIKGGTINAGNWDFVMWKTSKLNISSGTITAGDGENAEGKEYNPSYYIAQMNDASSVEVSGGTMETTGYGISLFDTSTIKMTGGSITANAFAITGFGNDTTSRDWEISGGHLESPKDYAIYLPHEGITTIKGDTEIVGEGGISIQRGTLNIQGNVKVTANGSIAPDTDATGDGTIGQDYAAVAVPSRYGPAIVNITGGTFVSKGYAKDYSVKQQNETSTNAKTITVEGGNFSDLTLLPFFKTGSTETITLYKDLSDISEVAFIDGNVTLDLNGHAITAAETMTTSLTSTDTLFGVRRGAKFTVNATGGGSITSSLCCTIKLTEKDDETRENYSTKEATLVVNGGTITGYEYAISGNGTRHGSDITINNGTFIATNTNVTDNTTGSKDAIALYQPQDGKLTIKGGSFTGFKSGVEHRSGTLLVEGGTFTSTASSFYAGVNGNGGTTRSAGLVIAQHNTYKAIDATIKGGTFTGGTNGYALYNLKNTVSNDYSKNPGEVSVKIQGGTFNQAIFSDESTKAVVTGGKFKVDPSDYYDTNSYQATLTDDYYIVGQKAE